MTELSKPLDAPSNPTVMWTVASQDFIQATERPSIASPQVSWPQIGIFLLLATGVLHFARDLVLPIVLALMLSLVFLPVVRALRRLWLPEPIGAFIVVIGLLACFIGGAITLSDPASEWLTRAPQSLRIVDAKLRGLLGSMHQMADATAQVQSLTQKLANGGTTPPPVQQVTLQSPSLAGTALGVVRGFSVVAVSTLVLLYFLLASGNTFLRKIINATPKFSDKKREVEIARQVEAAVSSYLFTVTTINAGLGVAVGLSLYLLGVPNPLLWGVMVALFNFVPYLGELTSLCILSVVGLLSFDHFGQIVLVPGVFYVLSALEGYLLTPLVLGRRLSLNPLVIVFSVLFWAWMWGIPGALLATPILVALKTLCDRVPSLQSLGEFLGA